MKKVLQRHLQLHLQLQLQLQLRLRLLLQRVYSNGADKLLVVLPADAGLLPVAVADPRKIHDSSEPWDTDALL